MQEKVCREYAEKNGYKVLHAFIEEGESAKTTHRTELQKLLRYATENRNRISVLIIHKIDRLSRDMFDFSDLVRVFVALGIEIKSATENFDNTPIGKFVKNLLASVAQLDNDVRSDRTSSGMRSAVKEGRWCWKAPIGYRNARDALNKATLLPSEDAPFIQEAFQLAETGLYKQIHIAKELKRKGFERATANLINRILRNPLYASVIRVGWFPEAIKALHQPLVSVETFTKVQLLLDGKRPFITPRTYNNPNFPLRNFVRCPKCGEKLTAGWSTGRNKKRYAYYHCRSGKCSLNVKKDTLESRFIEYLKSVQPKEDILALFKAIVLDRWECVRADEVKERNRVETELVTLEKERDIIEGLKIKNVFDDATYQRRSAELTGRIDQKQAELEDTKIELCDDIEGCLEYCGFFVSNVSNLWQDAGLDLKQRFQTIVFPDKIYFDGEKFGNTKTALIFNQLQQNPIQKSQVVAYSKFHWKQLLQELSAIYRMRELLPLHPQLIITDESR